jgi:hypothetical protein
MEESAVSIDKDRAAMRRCELQSGTTVEEALAFYHTLEPWMSRR